MMSRIRVRWLAVLGAVSLLAGLFGGAGSASAGTAKQRYIVAVRSASQYNAIRSRALRGGARVVRDMRQLNLMVIVASRGLRNSLAADARTVGVAADHIERLAPPVRPGAPGLRSAHRASLKAPRARPRSESGFTPDPAFGIPGLMWNFERERVPEAWNVTTGDPAVTVGVADTGLDFTHSELASKIDSVVDFTPLEDPPLCKTLFGLSDDDLAQQFGGPPTTDWYGHGSWIGGDIAAAADGTGINGIAPDVRLVSLKISQWCGFAYDSTLIASFLYAANHRIDLVNISFGGYLDRSDPDQDLIYRAYQRVVRYAFSKGTVIVAAAGNEHTRVGARGRVLSHGTLTIPGDELFDAFGLYEVPGGVPGVVDVAATGNIVVGSSPSCPPGSFEGVDATCKPESDAHQPTGVGELNQLPYYSNFGPRIDVAGAGGARKFNVPSADRGGTPGFPYTSEDGTTVFEEFSITSNWATQIPCFLLGSGGGAFPADQCYTSIQGTSMAAPQAVGVLALIASAYPQLRHHPGALIAILKSTANTNVHNFTLGLSATDTSPGDRTGIACDSGYCHFGGPAVPDDEVYGAGLVDAAAAVGAG